LPRRQLKRSVDFALVEVFAFTMRFLYICSAPFSMLA
jgi:hypothetical protein